MLFTGLLVGAALGLVLQRGRFCITGAFRDLWVSHSPRWFIAFLLAIAVQALGVALLTALGVIAPEVPRLSVIATVLGSFLFGAGMVLAGGCATGTYYRAGEGLVGSWFALAAYALSAAAAKSGVLAPVTQHLRRAWTTGLTTLPAAVGLPDWVGAIVLGVVAVFAVHAQLRRESARRPAMALPAQRTGVSRLLFERAWNPLTTGVLVGIVAVIAWPASWASGRHDGLGITTPSSNLVGLLVTGDRSCLDWGVLLVVGILVGSYLAARASGEFRVRVPSAQVIQRSIVGGVLMGVGAAWAGGCSIGNALVQTSLLSWQGWIALAFQILGVGAAAWVTIIRPRERRRRARALRREEPQEASAASRRARSPPPALADAVTRRRVSQYSDPIPTHQPVQEAIMRTVLRTEGLVCPFPVIEAEEAMADLVDGDELVIGFDCTQGTQSLPAWATDNGYTVTDFVRTGEASWSITVRK